MFQTNSSVRENNKRMRLDSSGMQKLLSLAVLYLKNASFKQGK